MRRSTRLIPNAFAAVVLTLAGLPLQAGAPGDGMPAGSRFSLLAGHLGTADNQMRRSTCFELRGEAGPDPAGTGAGGAGRWRVQHGFWAGAGAARSDTLFFHPFEVCHP